MLTERKFEKLLQAILRDVLAAEPSSYIRRVQTFEEAGVPIEDRGLEVTMAGDSEYQIPIAESRGPRVGELERTHGDPEGLQPFLVWTGQPSATYPTPAL
jgi:hypothetical protein